MEARRQKTPRVHSALRTPAEEPAVLSLMEDDDERHAAVLDLLRRVRLYMKDSKRGPLTLLMVAAHFGLSAGELRDDTQAWKDTNIRYERIQTALLAELHRRVLGNGFPAGSQLPKMALHMLELDLKERQLSSDNSPLAVGIGFEIRIVKYGEKGEKTD